MVTTYKHYNQELFIYIKKNFFSIKKIGPKPNNEINATKPDDDDDNMINVRLSLQTTICLL